MSETQTLSDTPAEISQPSMGELFRAFGRIGVLSFGGPTAQIALMQDVLVQEKRWMREQDFYGALSFCMLLPGPEAMQLATYSGWKLHGIRGGLLAGLLFVLPGAAVVLALAAIYAAFGDVPAVEAVFFGVKAAVLVIVIQALIKIANRALGEAAHWIIAGLAFAGIFALDLPFPLIVLAAGLYGYLSAGAAPPGTPRPAVSVKWPTTLATVVIWLAIWWGPLLAVMAATGFDSILAQLGIFFSKLAVVTFGGAYAVLAYMLQQVVEDYQWLTTAEMIDGLGLAETTPGPLILVTEFVGFLAAFGEGGWMMGLAGAGIALWATFAPCFLWIFAGAPYIERITAEPRLKGALSAITAAVVGVILNLALWFGLQVFFPTAETWTDVETLDLRVAGLAVLSGILLLALRWSILTTLGVAALAALALNAAGI